jgi:NAD(P)-dependent dehydrogenase (short-subunit alcohol dehydrogenase family)
MSFLSKTVIVTGSGKGIGRSIAMAYAAEGAAVIIAEKDRIAGMKTESDIRQASGTALFVETDVSCET